MKKFILEVLFVILLALVPLYIMQHHLDKCARKSYQPPYSSFNYIYNHALNADVVIFGNSRAQCHYNGLIMDSILSCNCYNLGLSGYSFDYHYNLQVLPYLERNNPPKLLIIEICTQAFFRHWNDDFRKEFLPFINYPDFRFYVDICKGISWKDKILPIKYYGWGIDDLLYLYQSQEGSSKYDCYKDCFTPLEIGHYSINFPDTLYDLERNKIIVNYFSSCVAKCKEENISLLLVCSPMHKADFYDKCRMDEFWQLMDSLAPNTPKLDYSLMFDSDTTYFAESTHLNSLGAELFTTKLAHDIDSLGLLK